MSDATVPAPQRELPAYVVLLADWGDYRAGRVLRGDADLLGAFDNEHVGYRTATAHECALAGFDV